MDLNEFQTRKQLIDVLLSEQGWNVGDSTQVVQEIDTKQSDFERCDYRVVGETFTNDLESKYADYLLLDSNGDPIAIIEAKRTSKDPLLTAKEQAGQYADDIESQLGSDVFIFLSNGHEIWFWDRERYPPRMVKGFFTRSDLERMRFQRDNLESFLNVEIDTDIVDRSKSIENSKRVLEHLQGGHRKALIVMATGTGKTRVAMSIIDVLLRKRWVQKVLFLADRRALRNQAMNRGYKEFFPNESRSKILMGQFDRNKRLYVSTIQTFMEIYNQKDENGRCLISPGEFDLIISDEAHRSIYNKWRDVFTYLDGIQIGLTATPADYIDKNTFRFFDCIDETPTAMYDYYEAVEDGVLVDFRKHVVGAQTHFQIEGVHREDLPEEEIEKLILKGLDDEEIDFEGTEIERKIAVIGTNEAIVREFMDNCVMDLSGNLPAKTIFFAITKKHARRLLEAFDKLYPEYKGTLAQVIISDDSRAQDLIENFKKNSMPRVAISVDMLDTGLDVPEVCNLVFAKPVRSKIKFWQMLGRGTRSDVTCDHKEWLPNGEKEYFKVFDFWRNFEYFNMKPEGDHNVSTESVSTRIFLARLHQMRRFLGREDEAHFDRVRDKIMSDIGSLPDDSITVKDSIREIERALSPDLWDNVGIDPLEFLKDRIAPLMRYQTGVNLKVASFTLFCERLGSALLDGNQQEIERQKAKIVEYLNCLPTTINAVKEKEHLIAKAVSHKFWDEICYGDTTFLIDQFSELMVFKTEEPIVQHVFDLDDSIQRRQIIEIGPDLREEYIEVYKESVEARIKDLAGSHPTVVKIVNGEIVTDEDLTELETTLYAPDLWISESNLRKVYDQGKGTLVQFIRKILGLYRFPDPAEKVKEAFQTYMIENNRSYSADQLNFLRTLQSVFVSRHHIKIEELWDPPFTNFGVNAPVPMFTDEELARFIMICDSMEKDLFGAEA